MKLKFSTLFFILFCLSASAQSEFQKYFSEFSEYQQFSLSSFDNTYVIAGSRWCEGSFYDFCAAKLDKNGAILWSKSFASPNDEFLSGLSVSPAGDILLGGYKSDSTGDYDFSLMKLNASGDLQWYKNYGGVGSEVTVFTGETPAGDFYISGNREVNQRPKVLKTNNTGTALWSKTFGTSEGEEDALVASLTKKGGIMVLGSLPSQKNFLMKINADGTVAWTNSYTAEHPQFLSSMKETSEGGFLITSSDYRCDDTGCHSYFSFIKLDPNGKVSWAKAVEGCLGTGRNGIETADGGFAFTGELRDSGYNKAVLIKTDNSGNLLWVKAYGHSESFGESFFVEQTGDNGFALLGVEESKTYLIKTDANGHSGCNENEMHPFLSNIHFALSGPIVLPEISETDSTAMAVCSGASFELTGTPICTTVGIAETSSGRECIVYPSPFGKVVTVELRDYPSEVGGLEFRLYDMYGRTVMQVPMTDRRLLIARGNMPGGMYFYELRGEGKIVSKGKIIAE